MAVTNYFVSPGSGNDTTGDGSIGTPWATAQKALDTITRDATNGDQINVQAGTADTLGAALSLATYGTPTTAAPLVIRGYTSAANDGGRGELNGNNGNFSIFTSTTVPITLMDMKLGNTGTAAPIISGPGSQWINCEIHTCSSNYPFLYMPSSCIGCYIHDIGGAYALRTGSGNTVGGAVSGNYLVHASGLSIIFIYSNYQSVVGNIVRGGSGDVSLNGIECGYGSGHHISHNICYSASANQASGILASNQVIVTNNIIVGFSGAGGEGLLAAGSVVLGNNAYYNCTTNEDTTASDYALSLGAAVALGADPFTDAANGDFSLTTAGKAALRGVGWPGAYLGAHANTDGHVTIGPIQYGEAEAGGGVVRRVMRVLGG